MRSIPNAKRTGPGDVAVGAGRLRLGLVAVRCGCHADIGCIANQGSVAKPVGVASAAQFADVGFSVAVGTKAVSTRITNATIADTIVARDVAGTGAVVLTGTKNFTYDAGSSIGVRIAIARSVEGSAGIAGGVGTPAGEGGGGQDEKEEKKQRRGCSGHGKTP